MNATNNNDAHLNSAVTWLRLKLERQSNEVNTEATSTTRKVKPRPVSDAELLEAERHMRTLEENPTSPPRFTVIADRLGLSDFERRLLLLCAAMEFDTRIANLCAHAQDHPQRTYPTFSLAFALFEHPTWDVLSPERPLRYWRLLEINQAVAQPLTTRPLRADERIVAALKGLDDLDERLLPYFLPLEPERQANRLPASQQANVDAALHALRSTPAQQMLPAIQLVGPDATSQTLIARRIARDLNIPAYRVALEHLPSGTELDTLARLWQRDSLIAPIAVLVDTLEANEQHEANLRLFVERGDGIVIIGTREVRRSPNRETLSIDVNKPTPREQRETWTKLLASSSQNDQNDQNNQNAPGRLSAQFNLGFDEIERLHQRAQNNPNPTFETIWDACRAAARPRLDALAQRLEVKANWDRFVLPNTELQQLKQIADQVRNRTTVYEDWGFASSMNRGLGINALFAGESGTGKTMAAEVIASELRLDLYRIDLANVVSKYIGETEKNLRNIFDAAEDGGMILFFDEADALFGKRSEVKDSHDRYANIEINYLLQRIESFRGLAILASNLKTSLDSAFVRRLRFIVNFPFPGLPERQRLWERVFPPETPTQNINNERLARFDLTGASIHNAAMHAAFLAARTKQTITMTHILQAIRSEYRKLERPINELDFQWTEPNPQPAKGAIA
jgi:AAA+ superfamily predicted ATPase